MHHKHVKLLSKTLGIKFLSSSEKYLDTPLFVKRDKTKSFQFLIDKFYTRLSNYKRTNLNGAGRTVVTKHVLSSLDVYHMSCFPFHKKITSKIDSIQRTFWWSKKNPRRATYFCSWNDIDKAADSSSWIWKGIVKGLVFLKANIVSKINDGTSTKIWSSNWLPFSNSPPVWISPNFNDYTFVSELIDVQNNNWNIGLLISLFSPDDVIKIRSLRININEKDSIMWDHTKSSAFTIKTTYNIYMNESSSVEVTSFWKKVWSLDCLPKIKFFMWKVFAQMLPVNFILMIYNPVVDDCCPLCRNDVESIIHLFFFCPIAATFGCY
ncbi:uncharacterized protein LOC113352385 [Papaver somniferum]|uniref:uncharacterized protein LOC113352385 n=1 Tax=Papaver somniferum TaxID=3469 RepID=UPI000E701B8D|nr:uncharacterized protein LOC113352385 [Papaver somniferum]